MTSIEKVTGLPVAPVTAALTVAVPGVDGSVHKVSLAMPPASVGTLWVAPGTNARAGSEGRMSIAKIA